MRPKEPKNTGRVGAFFDLDRTLIGVNSGFLYVLYERRHGRIGKRQFLRATFWLGLYHLAMIDMERAFGEAVRHYRGVPSEVLFERTREFFEEEVKATLQPGALVALSEHRDEGHPLILLTASSPYMSRLACETWELDDWLSNDFPTDDADQLLGTFEPPMCYGEGKVVRAQAWAEENDISLDDSFFYSDSYSDLPMLERVGHPRIVNPDPRLRREARRRDWPILHWG
ncbi:MAG: HAD family hydrolase [Bradymonadaceae bacterium]